ncbi:hypothetical protein AQUSIP_19850 [Aquicella siphonis]|uniref:Competence protein A n=1 Tax=Aquicella siphonis TaxID=254247 RepID=A0A5E4PJW9_9COXI|nr:pilus assembly protein PilM [Aquicella siphonis]VVC76661.1 hypothetical protein AQUSIP_19850 [Aquicella siphonis]
MRYFFTSPPLIGIDIQSSAIRIAQLKKIAGGYLVEQAGAADLPEGVMTDDRVRDWSCITEVLSKLVHTYGLRGLAAAVSLPVSLVRMQYVALPCGMPQAAIESEIHAQVQKDFPGMRDALCVDFKIGPESSAGDPDVFFVAARREYVTQYMNAVNAAGLNLKIVDIDIHALERVLDMAAYGPGLNREAHAIVYVIREAVSLLIFWNDEILFHQHWARAEADENLAQLSSRIHLFHAAFPGKSISVLGCYSPDGHLESRLCALQEKWKPQVRCLKPFSRLLPGASLNEKWDQEYMTEFFVACGSAMREIPPWQP